MGAPAPNGATRRGGVTVMALATPPDRRWRAPALAGLLIGTVGQVLLLVPILIYQMEFMLYPWAWPALAGALGIGLGGLAVWRCVRAGQRCAPAWLMLGATILVTLATLAGWLNMTAGMLVPMPAMPPGL